MPSFQRKVDQMVEMSWSDPELAYGLKHIDVKYVQTGRYNTLYEAVFRIMYRSDAKSKEDGTFLRN